MEIKIIVSDKGKSKTIELKSPEADKLIGLKIGDEVNGELIGIKGKLIITGGSDKDGFPMVEWLEGTKRTKVLLDSKPGFKPKERGQRKRKSVRGNTIADDIAQINMKLISEGEENKTA